MRARSAALFSPIPDEYVVYETGTGAALEGGTGVTLRAGDGYVILSWDTLSVASYLLSGYMKRDARSSEAALKYLLVGSAAAAVFRY